MSVHFSSETVEWETPYDTFAVLDAEFILNVDVCATDLNAKCVDYFTKEDDGLAQSWAGLRCWMNPPYGRQIGEWVKKAYESTHGGGTEVVVALLPSRTDTRWFHDYILHKAEIRFIKGRLKFGGHTNSAPFPSMVVIFRP